VLRTVGIDIGSTTSHAMFARLRLQRLADSLSSRYVVVERTVLHRSPIVLTPYAAGDLIDATALAADIATWYSSAGLTRADVDTGAVILTGTALESRNARELADLFADEGGAFVCATAGHALEARLAAHGSGSVARSRREHTTILHVDVGGGTTKLAQIEDGAIVATTAIAVGARSRSAGRDPDERQRIAQELADLRPPRGSRSLEESPNMRQAVRRRTTTTSAASSPPRSSRSERRYRRRSRSRATGSGRR